MSAARLAANPAASVQARLLRVSRQRKEELQLILSEFAIERFLYRLGASRHSERFVLKGATLFKLWSTERHRATWDLDLLGRGANDVESVVAVVRELCSIPAADGIVFDLENLSGELIRAAQEYAGVRVRFQARLDKARIPMQIDVGFGDAITPAPARLVYPTLLGHEPPEILAYPREAVVAEKLEAMVALGVTNSRMRDFYDVWTLASSFAFEGPVLAEAIRATFARRATPLPDPEPLVLTPEFLAAPERQTAWSAFLRRGRLAGPPDAGSLSVDLQRFFGPLLAALATGEGFDAAWRPPGPWTKAPP